MSRPQSANIMSPGIRLLRYVEFSVRYLSLGSALRNDFQLNTLQYYDAGLYEEYICALASKLVGRSRSISKQSIINMEAKKVYRSACSIGIISIVITFVSKYIFIIMNIIIINIKVIV